MSSEDDSILSTYMDGQLDFDQQQQVESALVAMPGLAENLRTLTSVRELVAGLPRHAGVDVTPQVMNRIRGLSRSQPRAASRQWGDRARRIAIVLSSISAAAVILLLARAVFTPRAGDPRGQEVSRQLTDNVITEPGSGATAGPIGGRGISVSFGSGAPSPRAANAKGDSPNSDPPVAAQQASTAVAVDATSTHGDLELSRRMLDNPGERRMFLIKSGTDGKAEQQVATVVERTSRLGFFKITVSQGIVIDPRHPEEATVFALLVNPKELGQLSAQLKSVTPDLREEQNADAGIATQLADIGQVQQFAPLPAADSVAPGEGLALRTRSSTAGNGGSPTGPIAERSSNLPTREQYHSAPVPPPTAIRSSTGFEPDQGTDGPAVEPGSRLVDATPHAPSHASDPLAVAKLAPSKPSPAIKEPEPTRSDEKILVLVWISKSRPD